MTITPEQFQAMTGRAPVQDDLDRCNCPEAGQLGHLSCGVCPTHKLPQFECARCGRTTLQNKSLTFPTNSPLC